jgi:hypothetical protein
MSQLDIRQKNNLPRQVYYDIVVTNIKTEEEDAPILQFSENRSNPILQNTGEYYLSIIRFQVDTPSLPIFIPEIELAPNTNPDLTIYSITLEYAGFAVRTPLLWVNQNANVSKPAPPSQQSNGIQAFSEYYYAYNYQILIRLIQTAFNTSFASLQTTVGVPLALAHAPIITWDVQTNTAVLTCESSFYNSTVATPIRIYFNSPLFNLFSSFPAKHLGQTNITFGRNYWLDVIQDNTNTILVPVSGPTIDQYIATQMNQEYTTTSTWTPISSIVFTSSTIPIVSNQLSAPLIYNDGRVIQSLNGNNANFAQIITDLATNDNNYKPNLLYSPSAQYRYIDMYGNAPLTNIDVSVFWKSKLGILVPFRLGSGGSCSIKFLFQRKDSI